MTSQHCPVCGSKVKSQDLSLFVLTEKLRKEIKNPILSKDSCSLIIDSATTLAQRDARIATRDWRAYIKDKWDDILGPEELAFLKRIHKQLPKTFDLIQALEIIQCFGIEDPDPRMR